jgi:hypothetical protein
VAEEPRQISVSRDALRADLAELELRLRGYFDASLAQKANHNTVIELTKRIDLHEAGVFPPAWDNKIKLLVDSTVGNQLNEINERNRNSWSLKSSKANVAIVFVALSSSGIALTALLHSFISMH